MKKEKITAIALGIIVVGLVGNVVLFFKPKSPQSKIAPSVSAVTATNTNADTSTNTVKEYTLAQVALHQGATDCWSVINGGVYDLTSWISQHPGGDGAILSICGKDGSAGFNSQHGGQGRPERILETYKIGQLK